MRNTRLLCFVLLGWKISEVYTSYKSNPKFRNSNGMSWSKFHDLQDISEFLEFEASKNPGIARTFSIGTSFEGRELKVISISKSNETKQAVFLDANIHAREWISSAVATYIIKELLNSQLEEVQSWTDEFDWYILPIVNPDGFAYSHKYDHFWRKSRSYRNNVTSNCIGTDLNRNFDFHWMEYGSSDDPCSQFYAGTEPFSDPESLALANFINSIASRLVFYLSLHSYGQYILIPFGNTSEPIPQADTYTRISRKTAYAIARRYGTKFRPGSWFKNLHPATGTSMDWVKNTHNVNLTLTFELRDTGRHKFMLPTNQIRPSALEFMDGLTVIINELKNGIPEIDPIRRSYFPNSPKTNIWQYINKLFWNPK